MQETLHRQRSQFAYRHVSRWESSIRASATTRVKSLPVQVRTQGVGVAVATLIHQDKYESRLLADLLADWLLRESPRKPLPPEQKPDGGKLLDAIMQADRAAYMAAQQEAIELLDDVKTFAQALEAGAKRHG